MDINVIVDKLTELLTIFFSSTIGKGLIIVALIYIGIWIFDDTPRQSRGGYTGGRDDYGEGYQSGYNRAMRDSDRYGNRGNGGDGADW